jgi:hypothetical protein
MLQLRRMTAFDPKRAFIDLVFVVDSIEAWLSGIDGISPSCVDM